MLLLGVSPEQAFRLSYLAYIPASVGAFAVSLLLSREQVNAAIQTIEPIGIIIAATLGIVVISYLLRFAKRSNIWIVDLALGSIALAIGIVVLVLEPSTTGAFSL